MPTQISATEQTVIEARAASRVASLRASIDRIDELLVSLTAERQRLARAVGVAKRTANLPPIDAGREQGVIDRITTLGHDHGLNESEAQAIAEHLIRLARTTQGLPVVSRREATAA